MVMEVRFKLPE